MKQDRLAHEACFAGAHRVSEIFSCLLRPEEKNEAFGRVYEELRDVLEDYQIQSRREEARLKPSRN